jgi:hypothetical protein
MNPTLRTILFAQPGPAIDLNFASGALPGALTTTGGANGTRTNAAGVLEAATCPRIDYSPTSIGTCVGLLLEEARTNVLLNSKLDGTNLSTQSVTTTAQSYTLSFYGTGTVTLSGAFVGSLVGSGAYPTRSNLTFTSTAASLTLTVSGSVQYAQLEAGSFATSFIPTAGASVTRTVDSVQMAGSSFSSWFNTSAGTFVGEFDTIYSGNAAASSGLFAAGTNARFAYLLNAAQTVATFDGSAGITATGNVSDTLLHKVASSYSAGANRMICVDGKTVASGTIAAAYTAGTTFFIGDISGGQPTNGHIRRIRYWKRQMSRTQMQSLST